jgi:hypothetical protein
LVVPKETSYDVAPIALQVSEAAVEIAVALFAGVGDDGVAGGCDVLPPETDTLSNVATLSTLVLLLVTASPTNTLEGIDTVVLPRTVQEVPFAEDDATIVLPVLARRSHVGGACVVELNPTLATP